MTIVIQTPSWIWYMCIKGASRHRPKALLAGRVKRAKMRQRFAQDSFCCLCRQFSPTMCLVYPAPFVPLTDPFVRSSSGLPTTVSRVVCPTRWLVVRHHVRYIRDQHGTHYRRDQPWPRYIQGTPIWGQSWPIYMSIRSYPLRGWQNGTRVDFFMQGSLAYRIIPVSDPYENWKENISERFITFLGHWLPRQLRAFPH